MPLIRFSWIIVFSVLALILVQHADAAVYGGSLEITPIGGGISNEVSIRELIIKAILFILDFVLLLGVVAIVIAGIYLIVSNGDEAQKDKAKNIVIYVVIGIILILLSRVIVIFVSNLLG